MPKRVSDLPDLEEKGEEGAFSPPPLKEENDENIDSPAGFYINSSNARIPTIESTEDIAFWWELVNK
ncbi:hypothetical protein COOONC_00907 [Cooperia oncophora]